VYDCTDHSRKRREGVGGEDDIVQHHEPIEGALSRDPPWLPVAIPVVRVEGEDGDDVGGCEDEWDFRSEREVEEVLVNAEG